MESELCQVITATALMTKVSFLNKEEIHPVWILCDNESTVDIFKNDEILTNIKKTQRPIEITGIGGQPTQVTLEGDILAFGTVHYHPEVAANILSFLDSQLTKRFKSITYNNEIKDAFFIKRDNGPEMEFLPSKEGLYHYDFNISIERSIAMKSMKKKVLVVTTVDELKRNFTKGEIEKADKARRLYVIVGRPSQKIFEEMIKRGKIMNNKVTIQDYRNAIKIYGKDLGVLKGKTVRNKPKPIQVHVMEKPESKDIVLSINVMYFTGLYFLITVSRSVVFIMAMVLQDRRRATIMKAIQQVK